MAEQRTMSTGEEKGPKTAGTSFIEERERDYTVSDAFDNRASGKYVIFEKDGTYQKYFLDLFNKSFSPKHEELISGQG